MEKHEKIGPVDKEPTEYEKVLDLVKLAMIAQDTATYRGVSNTTGRTAEKIAKDILKVFKKD